MVRISELLNCNRVVELAGSTKDQVLEELCDIVSALPEVTDRSRLLAAIRKREAMMSTGIGMGIAIPHAKTESVTDLVMAVGRSRQGIDFQALDSKPVYLVIFMAGSTTQGDDFLQLLAKIGSFFNSEEHRSQFLAARTTRDIYRLFKLMDDKGQHRGDHA
jgi:mannitol/fructose-specific phosphotransferase system IIA component (Ntr-type)